MGPPDPALASVTTTVDPAPEEMLDPASTGPGRSCTAAWLSSTVAWLSTLVSAVSGR